MLVAPQLVARGRVGPVIRVRRRADRNLNPTAILGRWSEFLDGYRSLAVGVFLAVVRAVIPISFPRMALPIRIKGLEDPIFCRPGTTDFHTLLQIWDDGEYRAAIRYAESPVKRVVDLGSNIGLSACYFSTLWPEAEILAVEPDPENVALAERNLAGLMKSQRVTIENCFVGVRPGFAIAVRDPGTGRNAIRMGSVTPDSGTATVPVRTMSQLIEKLPPGPIDFLKCDIEGAERELFEGGPKWLSRVKAFVVELHGLEPEWLLTAVRRSGASIERHEVQPVPGYDLTIVWARLRQT